MKLSKLSLIFSVALLLMVAINGAISLVVLGAFDRAQAVQDERLRHYASWASFDMRRTPSAVWCAATW